MTNEVLLLKTSFVSLVSKLSLCTTNEKVDILKDLLTRCISYTKKNKIDWEIKYREIKILEAEDKISFTKTKLLALTVFSYIQYDVELILKKLSVFEQNMLMCALLELNGLPLTITDINSLSECDDTKLCSILVVIRWYIVTFSSNIYPSLPKINLLAMGRTTNTEPVDSDIISQKVEDSIDKCIELYKEILTRKTPVKFHTTNINQALHLINDYIDTNDDGNDSYSLNESVEMATEELSKKQFQLSVDELTIYVSRELGMYYFYCEQMDLAKEYFDKIFTLKKTTIPMVYNYNFEQLGKFKQIINNSLNKTTPVKPLTRDLHKKLNELFNSPNIFPIKELTFIDNDMEVVFKEFKDIIRTKSAEQLQLAQISDSLRYCSRFVSFANKELLEERILTYNRKNLVWEQNGVASSFPHKKLFSIDHDDNTNDDISDTDESMEILSNLEIPCSDIIATFPESFVSEYFSAKMKNITTLNQNLLNSFKLQEITNLVNELIVYYKNDKAKVYTHLKSLHMVCSGFYDEFICTIECLQLSTILQIVLSKCYRYLKKSPSIDKQYMVPLIESLVQFVHSHSFQLNQLTYEKVVTIVEAEILACNIVYLSGANVNFIKEANNLLDQAFKYKNFELHPKIYIAAFTHMINYEEYPMLASRFNTQPIGHLSNVLGAFFLNKPTDNINPDAPLNNLVDLFGMFNDSSESTINISILDFKKWIDSITNLNFIKNVLSIFVSIYNDVIIDKTRSNLVHISELNELMQFNLKNKNVSTISNILLLKLICILSEKFLQLNYLLDIQLLRAESLYLLGDLHGCLNSFAWATVHFLKDIVGDYEENLLFNSFIDQTTAVRIADCFGKTDRPIEAACILQPYVDILNDNIVGTTVDDIVGLMKVSRVNLQLLGLVYDNSLLSLLSDAFLRKGLKDVYGKLIEIAAIPENTSNNPNFLIERIVVAKKVKLFNHIQNTCLFVTNN